MKRPPVGRYLFGLSAFLILLSGGLLVLVLTYMKMQTLASGERLSRSFAHVIEEQTTRTLQATDQGLQLAIDGLTQLAASGGLTPESAKRVLADQVQPLPFLRAMWVIDTKGRIVFDSASNNIGVDLSDRDYFLRYSSHPDTGFFIGAPVVSRLSGTWQVSVARPWRSASGALQGIVVAALEPRYFDQLWRTVGLGQDSSVALLRRDGLMMMRSPWVEASIGKRFSDNPLFTERLPAHTNGHYQTASAVDGQTRLYAYRTLSAQPELVVLVGLSQEVLLARWRDMGILGLTLWLLTTLVISVLCTLLYRAWAIRVQTESHLQNAKNYAENLISTANAMVVGLDQRGQVTLFNLAAQRITGYTPDDLAGKNWFEVLVPRHRFPQAWQEFARLMAGGMPKTFENPILTKSGDERYIVWQNNEIHENGHIVGTLSFGVDVTERNQAQAAARESEDRFRLLYESSLDAIMLTAPDGSIFGANPASCRLFGYTEAEIKQVGRAGLLDTTDPRLAKALDIRARTGHFNGELTFIRKNGDKFPGDISAATFQDKNGLRRSSLIIRDISQRKQAEDALRDSARQLQALSGRVLAVQETERRRVAIELHDELGQSLTAIKINLQAQERFTHQSPHAITAENIRIVDHALKQVRGLALALRPSVLDDLGLEPALRWLAEQTANRSSLLINIRATSLRVRLSPDLETTCFRIVQEALTNIVRHARAEQVLIELDVGPQELALNVQDDGIGFDLASAHAQAQRGTSMGLLGMQERASLIQGHLRIESSPGNGCTVYFRCAVTLHNQAL